MVLVIRHPFYDQLLSLFDIGYGLRTIGELIEDPFEQCRVDGLLGLEVVIKRAKANIGNFGDLETEIATDATPGLAAAFARDLDAFGAWMRSGGADEQTVAAALDVRQLGLESATQEAAADAARGRVP